jgi:hypothetical protein
MIYGIYEDSEFLWLDDSQELYRKQIKSLNEFQKVKLTPDIKKSGKKYCQLKVNGKKCYLHRLIYHMFNPDWDIKTRSKNSIIDHRDGNSLNNSINNLNLVTSQQNSQNNNSKHWWIHKKHNAIQTSIYKDGKEIGKSFSIKKHGYEKSIQLALDWYAENSKHYYRG